MDGTIRTRVGSADILVVLECRDRGRKSEVAWIRELKTRKEDTQAHGLIAISSTGVSAEAVRKARAHGIYIRKLERLSAEKLMGIRFNLDFIYYRTEAFNFSFYQTITDPGYIFKEEFLDTGVVSAQKNLCFVPGNDEPFTPLEIFDSWMKQPNPELDSMQFDDEGMSLPLRMDGSYDLGSLFISSSKGNLMVKSMSVNFRLIKAAPISLDAIGRLVYSDENSEPLFEAFQFAGSQTSVNLEINHISTSDIDLNKFGFSAGDSGIRNMRKVSEFSLKISHKQKLP